MSKIKICGVTCVADALLAESLGAAFIGLIFTRHSKRRVTTDQAKEITDALTSAKSVGVFVDASREELENTRRQVGFDLFQLSGDEPPELAASLSAPVFKSFRLQREADLEQIDAYPGLYAALPEPCVEGAYGGTGQIADWTLAQRAAERYRVVLAGGLTPANIAAAIEKVRPFAVDVASGVEVSPGIKDHLKLKQFLAAAGGRHD